MSAIGTSHFTGGVSMPCVPGRGSANQASKPPESPMVNAVQASVPGSAWTNPLSRFHMLIGWKRSTVLPSSGQLPAA